MPFAPLTPPTPPKSFAPLTKRALTLAVLLTTAVAASASAPSVALAQGGDAKQRADAAYKDGIELAKAGKTDAALARFEAANSFLPSGMALYQIARMEQLLGRHALALQHFREALRETNLTTDARRDAERSVEDLKTKIGVITLDVPPGATATVDGNEVDARASVEVVPGLHVVKVRLAAESKSVDVTAPAGAVTPVKVRFGEDAPPPIQPDHATSPPPPPSSPPTFWTPGRMVGVGLAAAGVLSIGLGVIFQVDASSSGDDASKLRDALPPPHDSACSNPANAAPCNDLKSAVDDQHSEQNLRTGFLVAGGALLIGGAVVFLVSPPRNATPKDAAPAKDALANGLRVLPTIAPRQSGLAITGRF